MMEKIKLIIDTDIGTDIDDAFALQFVLNSPEIELLGITTVYKNVYQRAKIAKHMLNLNHKDVGVYCGKNLILKESEEIYDTKDVASKELFQIEHYLDEMETAKVEKEHAVDFILRTVAENPYEITLLAIGNLTNLAAAFKKDPETFKKIKKIHIMGGSLFDERCEWNFYCDADAAATVVQCGVPMQIYGIDVAQICVLTPNDLDYYWNLKTDKNFVLTKMLKKWHNKHKREPIMYDPLAAACLVREFCEYIEVPLMVETETIEESRFKRRGLLRVICSDSASENIPKVKIGVGVKIEEFLAFLRSRIYD